MKTEREFFKELSIPTDYIEILTEILDVKKKAFAMDVIMQSRFGTRCVDGRLYYKISFSENNILSKDEVD